MTEYISKQVQILRPAADVYAVFADFNNFTPLVADRVEGWQATADECAFKIKGMNVSLHIVERQPGRLIKFEGAVPFDFALWIQLQEVGTEVEPPQAATVQSPDTRMRLVMHAQIPAMLRMMLGKKLADGLDSAADQIAAMFNMTR